MATLYADTELGEVVSRYTCPDCGEDLVLEFREEMPPSMFGLACPSHHVGLAIRVNGAWKFDECFESSTDCAPHCINCGDQIIEAEPVVVDDDPTHPGECAEDRRSDLERLAAMEGGR